jgi:hypothetical protein
VVYCSVRDWNLLLTKKSSHLESWLLPASAQIGWSAGRMESDFIVAVQCIVPKIRSMYSQAQKNVDPGDLDPDSDPDPDPQHCSYVHIEFFRP